MNAVFLDYETVSNSDLSVSNLVRLLPTLRFHDSTSASQLAARLEEAEIVLLNKLRLTREVLLAAPKLRLIALAATGTDNVDLATARERGIGVCNVCGYCTASVIQHVWAMILSLTQRLPTYQRFVADGSWSRGSEPGIREHSIRELAGHTLGIVGWGELGRGVARAAEAFAMRVVVADRPGGAARSGRVPLPELLRTADVVSLHCPLTPATRGLIGAAELALMKPDALLINTARGALIDSAALAQALRAGRLGGAGIDVLAQEPPADGDPLLDPAIPNLVVTPHMAWAARESRQRCLDEMAANIQDFLSGGRRGRVV